MVGMVIPTIFVSEIFLSFFSQVNKHLNFYGTLIKNYTEGESENLPFWRNTYEILILHLCSSNTGPSYLGRLQANFRPRCRQIVKLKCLYQTKI